jgi:prepilin-type N-terminal cleavage/methylation domain-containing protein
MPVRGRNGFTMIEVLIVVGLFSLIAASLFQSFSMGLKVWKTASRPDFSYRKAVLNLERISQEIRHARPYPGAMLTGTQEEIAFTSVMHQKVYNLTYVFKSEGLWRRADVVGAGVAEEGALREVVPRVRQVTFSYFGFDALAGGFVFFDEWDGALKGLPKAVRVAIDLEDETRVERTTYVPTTL